MTLPKVTVIVVNYNSRDKWHIVEHCLKKIFSLKYRPIKIIIVDNGSTDGSYELIEQLVKCTEQNEKIEIRVLRLSRNYGFAIANIIAYKLRDPRSKYVALINNDLAPEPNSLERLVSILEKYPKIAGIQGIILSWDGRYIDSYGALVTDHGICYNVASGMRHVGVQKLKPIVVTYVDGAFSVYRVDALERAGGLFIPYFFMWGDDYELGIRLWRSGYILMAVPIVVGKHYRGASTQLDRCNTIFIPPRLPYILEYWSWASDIAVTVVLYGYIYPLQLLKRIPTTFIAALLKHSKAILRGFLDGIRLGLRLRKMVLNQKPWLKVPKEPRLKSRLLWELALLIRLYLKYGMKASRIYYILIARSLSKRFT